jgi:hypothetical protein
MRPPPRWRTPSLPEPEEFTALGDPVLFQLMVAKAQYKSEDIPDPKQIQLEGQPRWGKNTKIEVRAKALESNLRALYPPKAKSKTTTAMALFDKYVLAEGSLMERKLASVAATHALWRIYRWQQEGKPLGISKSEYCYASGIAPPAATWMAKVPEWIELAGGTYAWEVFGIPGMETEPGEDSDGSADNDPRQETGSPRESAHAQDQDQEEAPGPLFRHRGRYVPRRGWQRRRR